MKQQRIGVWLLGAQGGVATTTIVGLVALRNGLTGNQGLVSALPRFAGLDLLEQALSEFFMADQVHGWLQLPPSAGRLRAAIYKTGEVLSDAPDAEGGWWLEIRMSVRELEALYRSEGHKYPLLQDREPERVAGVAQAP